jgi:hypothetical protein
MALFEKREIKAQVAGLDRDINDLKDAIRRLSGAVAQLEDRHARLEAQHLSLRGYTYSLKAQHVAGLSPAPSIATRDDLRRVSGFRPGKPMEHNDGN